MHRIVLGMGVVVAFGACSGGGGPGALVSVPGPPTSVTATAGDASATVTWVPAPSSGEPAPSRYTVTSSPEGKTATVAAPKTQATVTGLKNGQRYTFSVVATNQYGDSLPSGDSNQVWPKGPPGAPADVVATAGDRSATVTFTGPFDGGGANLVRFIATAHPGGATGQAPDVPVTVTGLTNGTAYTFTLVAENAEGTGPSSAPSAPVTPLCLDPAFVKVVTPVGPGAMDFRVADLDEDGHLDLVVHDTAGLAILLGTGGGHFVLARTLTLGTSLTDLAVGDLDGDGHVDIAATDQDPTSGQTQVELLLGKGDGTFTRKTPLPMPDVFMGLALGDLDGDGHLDLVSAGNARVDVAFGTGPGTFGPAAVYYTDPAGGRIEGLRVVDATGDGIDDVVYTNPAAYAFDVLPGSHQRQASAPLVLAAHLGTFAEDVIDLDHDGRPDVLAVSGGVVYAFLGQPGGTFGPETQFDFASPTGAGGGVVVPDLNGDGKVDVAFLGHVGAQNFVGVDLDIDVAAQTAGPAPTYPFDAYGEYLRDADLDGDGRPDLVATDANGQVEVFLNRCH